MKTNLTNLNQWVEEIKQLTNPKEVVWINGSDQENEQLLQRMVEAKSLIPLNPTLRPGSYLHRSNPNDVARVEHLTFVCTKNKNDAGPNNHWEEPSVAKDRMDRLFNNCMQGRTMYVIPYCMGPIDSPLSRCGVEITDSAYVVINMRLMTRVGTAALKRIEADKTFVRGIHSTGDLDPEKRYIMHFPEDKLIMSFGSGYGGNALLGKKCHALRIASFQAKEEGWLAEHMVIVGIQNPQGVTHYVVAAFPSACGKTNLAMLIPPKEFEGYKIWTVGDDIAWLHPGDDGRLYAINPEAGYFGVAPGTGKDTNPTALATIDKNTIFTNVALTADKDVWWEGLSAQPPSDMINWKGQPHGPNTGPAAHPNSRFTVSAKQCPSYSPEAENPRGVPISAIIFGGRRKDLVPLVLEARDWTHGVLLGASVASETTAAASGKTGVVRRDSMAMKPFCGYNFGDYWAHWLSFDKKCKNLPKIFHVNWFRKDEDGRFIWPGFGDNIRVLDWITKRCEGKIDATQTPIGALPKPGDISLKGTKVSEVDFSTLTKVDHKLWKQEVGDLEEYFSIYGDRFPEEMKQYLSNIKSELSI